MDGELSGAGIDFLTASVPCEVAEELQAHSEALEAGTGKPTGFRRSELRAILGGTVWRRWEPVQACRSWGLGYESWEADGGNGSAFAELLALRECRSTRIDYAFDISVEKSMTARAFQERALLAVQDRRLSDGIWKQGKRDVRYLGAPKSERRLRIYRKDKQSQAFAFANGPTLRVELVGKGPMARGLWAAHRQGKDRGTMAAAGQVFEMCGCIVHESGPLGPIELNAELEPAQMLFEWMRQNASMIVLAEQKGIPLTELCQEWAERCWTKQTRHNHRRRERKFSSCTTDELVEFIRGMMASKAAGSL